MAGTRVLFVDDEPAIRETLPRILALHGYEVSSVGTVAEALAAITSQTFDLLITDLNIGQPGDGFTVVSGMRRTQPECVNFILTGYPALETALQAIRRQVDGYLIKPTNIPALIAEIEQKLKSPTRHRPVLSKRLSGLLRESSDEILERTLAYMKTDAELAHLPLSDADRIAPIRSIITALADVLDSPEGMCHEASQVAAQWAKVRHEQGFSIQLLIKHTRLLESAIFDVVNDNLLAVNMSYFMTDLKRANCTLFLLAESFMRIFQELDAAH